jgi:hypothetical protein
MNITLVQNFERRTEESLVSLSFSVEARCPRVSGDVAKPKAKLASGHASFRLRRLSDDVVDVVCCPI